MGKLTIIPPNHPIYSHFTKLKGNKRSKRCIIIDTKKQVRFNLGEEVKGKKIKNRRPSSSSVEEIRDHGIWVATTNREIRSQVKALSKRQ